MKNKLRLIIQIILGIVFLTSGTFKAMDSQSFLSLINAYGFGWAGIIAPLISATEIIIGLCLILNIQPLLTVKITALITIVFTILFSYAFYVRGIEDCGCMGPLVKTSPYISLIRNALIIIGCLWILHNFKGTMFPTKNWKKWVVYILGGISLCVAGYTLGNPLIEKVDKIKEGDQVDATIFKYFSDKISKDTCIIFVFSPECNHCWNTTENVKSIKKTPGFSKVFGITYPDVDTSEYMKEMEPNFEILQYPNDELYDYISGIPFLLVLNDGKVIKKFDSKDIPCGPMLKKMLE